MSKKKKPTKDESEYMGKVAALGCIISGRPAVLHHPRFCAGMSQRSPNFLVIPLAPEYHNQGAYGHCVHNGYQIFKMNYMSEEEMLAEVIRRLNT